VGCTPLGATPWVGGGGDVGVCLPAVALLVVQFNTGKLFHVDSATGSGSTAEAGRLAETAKKRPASWTARRGPFSNAGGSREVLVPPRPCIVATSDTKCRRSDECRVLPALGLEHDVLLQ
jgi:hypothetical protein